MEYNEIGSIFKLLLVVAVIVIFLISAFQHDMRAQSIRDLCKLDGGIPIGGYCFSPDALLSDPD